MRLFIALRLPVACKNRLADIIRAVKSTNDPAKWVSSENIHLTLRFLGESPETTVEPLGDMLKRVAEQFGPVHTTVDNLGFFPNSRRPRVIWAGLSGSIGSLERLAEELERGVQPIGFRPENKPFRPHLTLARIRDRGDTSALLARLKSYRVKSFALPFDSLVLFKSTLTPRGPIYEPLVSALLTGSAD